jgi:hypothetical protein
MSAGKYIVLFNAQSTRHQSCHQIFHSFVGDGWNIEGILGEGEDRPIPESVQTNC